MQARHLRSLLPLFTLAALTFSIFYLQPRTISYFGINLLFNYALPIALATVAQMFIVAINEIDLSIGALVSFVTAAAVTWLASAPLLAIAIFAGAVLSHALIGALIQLRRMPSIVVTLGLSFFWSGCALLVRPLPGGEAPRWLTDIVQWQTPVMPFPILAGAAVGITVHMLLMSSAIGVVLRGAGGNPTAIERAGWSLVWIKAAMFGLAGTFGVFSGLSLAGLSVSADSDVAANYTLLSIAGAILGGARFVGGIVSPVGAVLGAATLTIAASFLTFINVPTDWQIGAQGVILIVALSLRNLIERHDRNQ